MRWLLSLCLALTLASGLRGEEVVIGLSQDEVAITTTFDGSDLLIFGAIKREAPIATDSTLHVIITVAGPSRPVTVRRKDRVAGIWANVDAVNVSAAPTFYAVASSGPLSEALRQVDDLRHSITIPRAIRAVGAPMEIPSAVPYTDALIRIRAGDELYQILEGGVELDQETLFRAELTLPANLTEGDYRTRIFLTRDGTVVASYETTIPVNKVGLERWLFDLSRNQPLLYGLMSLAIAIAAGWLAAAAFRLIQK